MELEEYKKHLSKFKKSEIIEFLIKKDAEKKQSQIDMKNKYEKSHRGMKQEIFRLQKYIANFREISDKFGIKKGNFIFVEYQSEIEGIRTNSGFFEEETMKQIKIRVKDSKGYYNYYIKKKLINGIKEYREN